MKSETANRPRRATILDVAQAAGVSVSSVSNLQNGRRNHLRPETCERIQSAIDALGYAPNRIARQLKSGHSPMIGLLIPSVDNPYHAEIALALDNAAQRRGFRLVLGNGHRTPEREKAFIDELIEYGVRGFIVTSELRDQKALRQYVQQGIAFVLFDLRLSEVGIGNIDVVSIDNKLATQIAVDHLAELGHKSIAFVTPEPMSFNRLARKEGYVAALRKNRLAKPVVLTTNSDVRPEHGDSNLASFGEMAARELLRAHGKVTAIIGVNGIVTAGILSGLRQLDIEVPQRISLVAIDDLKLLSLLVPTLTTLATDYGAMAEQAVSFLESRLAMPRQAGREQVYPPRLVIRQSSGKPGI